MKRLSGIVIVAAAVVAGTVVARMAESSPPAGAEGPAAERFAAAERLYAEGSYALARAAYLRLQESGPAPAEARWIEFRLADTLWRSQAATERADVSLQERARESLETIIAAARRDEDRDRVWAEAQESLGDFWWTRRDAHNWSQGWNHYRPALDWWAGAVDIEVARRRYIAMVWKMARPPWVEPYYRYSSYGNVLPLEILDNVVAIAESASDRARAHYLIGLTLRYQGGGPERIRRVPEEFEAAIAAGRGTDWYDDALFHYADWMARTGRIVPMENGTWRQEPDYVRAVELYRRLLREFDKGDTRYHDDARGRIETITGPELGIAVSNFFLPESEIRYHLNWRNLDRIDLSLFRVDLTRDVAFRDRDAGAREWLAQVDLVAAERVARWSHDTGDQGDHRPGREEMRLLEELPPGAYVLEANGAGKTARELILITDAAVVLKTVRGKVLIFVTDVLDGSPLSGARVRILERNEIDEKPVWRETVTATGDDGLVLHELSGPQDDGNAWELFVAVSAGNGDRQAFAASASFRNVAGRDAWKIYAYTDRPAYRPDETVNWKLVARRYDGSVYSTPAGARLEYIISDPRGAEIQKAEATLNPFGSAWGETAIDAAMPLGEYRIRFRDPVADDHVGQAVLFRVEEYKLPEFRVEVRTPEEDGRSKAFRLGERVEVVVEAEYYFGGPVPNADVELVVHQNPFHHWWSPRRDFPWFYADMEPTRWARWGGAGPVILRETRKTDADGRATFAFDTPANAGNDFEYRIEARVTDASRREIAATGNVRVTRQRYFVYPRARHNLYRPQDRVTVDIRTLDANDGPVEASGTVTVTRRRWIEAWWDPSGRLVQGEELDRLKRGSHVFPPQPEPSERPWQLKFRGYETEEILTRTVKTDATGSAEFRFVPERDGYYQVSWRSGAPGEPPITASIDVWVATGASNDIGYRHGGIEIIVDRDTFRSGDTAPVMLSVPTNDRWVLFTVEGEDLYEYRVIHLDGPVKFLQLEIGEEHIPNIFLGALMVSDRNLYSDTEQVVVPPVDQFLEVEVGFDREQYEPRDPGTATIVTRDRHGNPVAAEVSFGVVDESVYFIQQDYAGDPRQFFFGDKRSHEVATRSSFQIRGYALLGFDEERRFFEITAEGRSREEQQFDVDGRQVVVGDYRDVLVLEPGVMEAPEVLSEAEGDFAAARGIAGIAPKKSMMPVEEKERLQSLGYLGSGEEGPAVQVRTDFRSTVLWRPDVVTGEDGRATVELTMPDSLTGWRGTVRAATTGARFGIGTATTRTRKPLIVRLQAPRFFVVGDTVTVSAVVNNNTGEPLEVSPRIEVEGLELGRDDSFIGGSPSVLNNRVLTVPAGGEARRDWQVVVPEAGIAVVTVQASAGGHSDAMRKTYTVFEHGIEKFVSKSGKMRGDGVTVSLDIPRERRPGSTELIVQVAPSLAVTMLDALPYLIDYPYGCTEQTMSRFLPAVFVMKTLRDLGLEPEEIAARMFGGIEAEHAAATHPDGARDLKKLDDMIDKGLKRLYDFQHADGGWGWWKEGDSDHFMTAYVVWGLTLADQAGVRVRGGVLDRAVNFLDTEIVEAEERYDLQAWMLHALAVHHAANRGAGAPRHQARALDNLWENRDRLNAYTRALLTLAAHHYGDTEKAEILIRNLENGAIIDESPDTSVIQRGPQASHGAVVGTAHWGEDGRWWRWSDGAVESTAFALRALLAVDPDNDLVEPVTNWLLRNRRGAQWSNTRDTAIAVLTFTEYLQRSGELKTDLEYELSVNGESIATRRITLDDILSAPSRFPIAPSLVRDGVNEIRIVRSAGDGPLYFSAAATFFSLEEPVTPAGNEIFVRRQYYRRVGRPTLLKGFVYDRVPLGDGDRVRSGDRIETVITIEAKNDYEYLVFEDLKPAGFEAVAVRSGEPLYARELKSSAVQGRFVSGEFREADSTDTTGRARRVYQELRDRKVALFVDKLPGGVWEIRYEMRAEVPGEFHALPVKGFAMYVPEIRANGAEVRLLVEDRPE